MINFCLIGAGRIGKVHALAVQSVPGTRISHIVDAFPQSAEALAADFGAEVVSEDAAFAHPDIDAYIIASSTDTHSPLLARCAAVGKPVFCETPIDLDYGRAEQCSQAVAEAGITCMLGFNRRFDPQFSELKQRLASGAVGQLETLQHP